MQSKKTELKKYERKCHRYEKNNTYVINIKKK